MKVSKSAYVVIAVAITLLLLVIALALAPDAKSQGPIEDAAPGRIDLIMRPKPSSDNVMLYRAPGYVYEFWYTVKEDQYRIGKLQIEINGPKRWNGTTIPAYNVRSVTPGFFNMTDPGNPPEPGDMLQWRREDLPWDSTCRCYFAGYTITPWTLGQITFAQHWARVLWIPGGASGKSIWIEWRPFDPDHFAFLPIVVKGK